jgi:hypothetical protein
MNSLSASDIVSFQRKYRFAGAVLRRVRIMHRGPKAIAVEFRLTVRQAIKNLGEAPARVRLTLRLNGVEEFRFQMRPNMPKMKVADARLAFLNNSFFVNFDAWSLEPGEQPRVHDFRASELYASGRELLWEERG